MSADQSERPSERAARTWFNQTEGTASALYAHYRECRVADLSNVIAQETSCDTLAAELASAKREIEEARRDVREAVNLLRLAVPFCENDSTVYSGTFFGKFAADRLKEIQSFLSRKGGV